jgi:nucleoid-associated protein YgaU
VRQQFTLFTSAGMPVRARLSVSFTEFRLPVEEAERQPHRGSFPAQTHTVTAGETLSGIAAALWKDARQWRRMAIANNIDNPRLLQAGRVLVVPAVE